MSAAKPASETMTLAEACEYLGRNDRSVRSYVKAGKFKVTYITNGTSGKSAIFDRGELERFKIERDTPVVRAVKSPADNGNRELPGSTDTANTDSMTVTQTRVFDLLRVVSALQNARTPPVAAPFLTLPDAATYSGLPKRLLAKLCRDGKLPAMNYSDEWYVKRADLDALELGRAK